MRFLSLLLLLILLAGAGFAAYWFLYKADDSPVKKARAYPKTSTSLGENITIGTAPWGYTELSGETWRDLLYAQGLQHGVRAGKRLLGLRELFKGNADAPVGPELQSLTDWFHYIDLETTAQESVDLYPANARVLLQQYVDGLNDASDQDDAWTLADVLLMQRGYAFFLGQNFSKEMIASFLQRQLGPATYQQVRHYPGPVASLPPDLYFADTLRPLFEGPYLEWIRLQDARGTLASLSRCKPKWRRLIVPTSFRKGEDYNAHGIALAGIPFLWSGQTPQLQFQIQPILANDDQLLLVPTVLIESDAALLQRRQDDPSNQGRDQPAGIAPFGRDITPMVTGAGNNLLFYEWAGFKPSADLLFLWRLLAAENLDQAQAALSLHHVPAAEITLGQQQQAVLRFTLTPPMRPSNLQLFQQTPPFDGANIQRQIPQAGLRSWSFSRQHRLDLEQWRNLDQFPSQADQQLSDTLQSWVAARLGGRISNATREGINAALRQSDAIQRSYFIHLAWQELENTFCAGFTEEIPPYMLNSAKPEIRAFILSVIAREPGGVAVAQREVHIAQALARTLQRFQQAAQHTPPWPLDTSADLTASAYAPLMSEDAIMTPFTLQSSGRQRLQTQTQANFFITWRDQSQEIWPFPFQSGQELGWPKKIYRDSAGVKKSVTVRAKTP